MKRLENRNRAILFNVLEGEPMSKVGRRYGISGPRVHQVISELIRTRYHEYYYMLKTKTGSIDTTLLKKLPAPMLEYLKIPGRQVLASGFLDVTGKRADRKDMK